jgi:hypothetical protein
VLSKFTRGSGRAPLVVVACRRPALSCASGSNLENPSTVTRVASPHPPSPLTGTPYLTLHDAISSRSFRVFFLFASLNLLNVSSSSVSAMESSELKSP